MANLTTLAEYKEAEGINAPKEDARIDVLVPAVSQLVKTYCGNSIVDFYSTNKSEIISINWDTYAIQLTESPVNTIVSVSERSSYAESYVALTTAAHEYFLDTTTDSLIRTNTTGYRNWPKGVGAVQVVYTAGYATVPEDLKLAVFDLITYYLKDEHKERRVLAGASIQNQSTTSMRNNVAFPDHIKRVLDLYKNF
ncbi:MAG: hypothetical protein CBB97_22200 [Candidatus Endolissoclinum sp. TMED37]|nr:MAG: hypothetical protein CBB97_22200 [Candidatus Endolissoclinum sp. TMED37]|tara:strand:+ start:1011 stop:1598 length:588 start_codon:yes stop_codon:yes gene_type:complete